jgi:hypothetical protein
MNFLGKLRGNKSNQAAATQTIQNQYANLCFNFDLTEGSDDRRMPDIPELYGIFTQEMQKAYCGHLENCRAAIPLIEAAMQKYPDYHTLYHWLGYCTKKLHGNDEARKIYLAGLEKCRLRASLCGGLGMLAFEENNLAVAVLWWIRSCASSQTAKTTKTTPLF